MIERRAAVIANEIRLLRQQHAGSFLVVEGRDDRLFAERFAPRPGCRIVVAEGKRKVCEVIGVLEQGGFAGVSGLIDSDHDRLLGVEHQSQNVLVPETHSVESLLVRSGALDAVLVEFGSAEKLAVLTREVRQILADAVYPLGCLRLHSARNDLSLRFDGLNYAAFLNIDTLVADAQALIQEVKNRSQRQDLSSHELHAAINAVAEEGLNAAELCSGEDLLGALSVALRRLMGTHAGRAVSSDELRRALRLAFPEAEFQASQLYAAIRAWESRNPPFRILP